LSETRFALLAGDPLFNLLAQSHGLADSIAPSASAPTTLHQPQLASHDPRGALEAFDRDAAVVEPVLEV
jgi:hypothetical protein